MAIDIMNVVEDVSEVMKFENWMRFYFIKEEEGDVLRIEIPEEQMAFIKKEHENMYSLAERYNGELIDYEKSCQETCAHVAHLYDGVKYPAGTVTSLWDSKELKLEMYLFGVWMQGHENQLDEELMPFAEWMKGFDFWKNTDEVKDYMARLTDVSGQKGCGCKSNQ